MEQVFNSRENSEAQNANKLTKLAQRPTSRRTFFQRSAIGAVIATAAPAALLAACGGQTTTTGSGNTTTATATTAASPSVTTATFAYPTLDKTGAAFMEIMNDENAHVSFLHSALVKAGATPRPKPTFKSLKQSDVSSFANLSQVFENVGVGAYLMAAPAIKSSAYLAAAGSILTIEARHAGFIDVLLNKPISANGAFDKPLTQAAIVNDVSPFIVSLNGGPNPAAPLTNDADILNFALLLEYLEAEFYNLNVPAFFK